MQLQLCRFPCCSLLFLHSISYLSGTERTLPSASKEQKGCKTHLPCCIYLIIASWSISARSYLSLDAWADRLKLWLLKTRNWYYGESKTKSGENEANPHSYFAESTHVHSPKPEYIKFRVGQVIIHRKFGYSGVIVGWDVKANTPEEQLQLRYLPVKQGLKDTPHYRILINKANGFGKSTAYVPEEEITVIIGLEVYHPDMETYFSGYDGLKYIMQPWLKKLYPHD
ncbi:F-box only protein 21-like isoform X1 [Oenanthe melanoleuca]|uniref:F-box only protein 21-like isoform X1 n=1 Tax=Oenanthe melanoleuca TaxID=2939378 RepID=UPI0024C10784|nr:F-box only protein 21-like isoform X1 [Oenanthe melanoleuca]